MKKMAFHSFLGMFLFFLSVSSLMAQKEVRLQFQRTGVDDSSVSIHVLDEHGSPLTGATASVVSSHRFRSSEHSITSAILCPQANALDHPSVDMMFQLQNLPQGFRFDRVEMDVHALNGKAEYHKNNDGLSRQYTMQVHVSTGTTSHLLGTLNDVDIAAGIGAAGRVHGWWGVTDTTTQVTDGSLKLKISICTGKENTGCYWGLSEVVLKEMDNADPLPDGETLTPGVYTISWKNDGTSFMSEATDGQLRVHPYAVDCPIFWELIKSDHPHGFYIRNTATGHYIGSCNYPSGSATVIRTSSTPVEFYVGATSSTHPDNRGCMYLSSTDCADYANELSQPMALNKSGNSDYVVAWETGPTHHGSYWKLQPSDDKYDLRPFKTSPSVGNSLYTYVISSSKGKQLEMQADYSLHWAEARPVEAQLWYVVGTGNKGTGYILVNGHYHQPIVSPDGFTTSWRVFLGEGINTYGFRPMSEGTAGQQSLIVDTDSLFTFRMTRTPYARQLQIYGIPCGRLGSTYVVQANLTGEVVKPMQYPMSFIQGSQLIVPKAPKPQRWYSFYTQNQATVIAGKTFEVQFTLNDIPAKDVEAYLYFDWDMDGIFETSHSLIVSHTIKQEINVPAWVVDGKTRMRLRLTDNGLSEAEDDVVGQTFDWVVNTVAEAPSVSTLQVVINDPSRGEVSPMNDSGHQKECVVTAYPKGNAQFVCWREGRNVLSLDATYRFTLNHPTTLIACFSPNTLDDGTQIESTNAVDNHLIQITAEQRQIHVVTAARIQRVMVFTTTGSLVAESSTQVVELSNVDSGTYIVKVYTDVHDKSVKLLLK